MIMYASLTFLMNLAQDGRPATSYARVFCDIVMRRCCRRFWLTGGVDG